MRILFAFLVFSAVSAFGGQLNIAVISFPEAKDVEELNAALARVNLAEITNSNRTMTTESYLKGGYVKFAQSLPVSPGQRFASATRLDNSRADVSGSLGTGQLSVSIAVSEGVDAGLRRFSRRVYEGSASLPTGPARVISLRQVTGKTQSVIKGKSTTKELDFSTALVAQYSN